MVPEAVPQPVPLTVPAACTIQPVPFTVLLPVPAVVPQPVPKAVLQPVPAAVPQPVPSAVPRLLLRLKNGRRQALDDDNGVNNIGDRDASKKRLSTLLLCGPV